MNQLQELIDAVNAMQGVAESAVALIGGISARVQAAVDAALAGGATGAQIAAIIGNELNELNAVKDALAAAVAANP